MISLFFDHLNDFFIIFINLANRIFQILYFFVFYASFICDIIYCCFCSIIYFFSCVPHVWFSLCVDGALVVIFVCMRGAPRSQESRTAEG